MIAFMPDHVLQQKDWMVVMNVHVATGFQSALHRIPHSLGALVEKLCHAERISLRRPLLRRYLNGLFWNVLRHKHKTHIMNVSKKFSERGTALHCPDVKCSFRNGPKQID